MWNRDGIAVLLDGTPGSGSGLDKRIPHRKYSTSTAAFIAALLVTGASAAGLTTPPKDSSSPFAEFGLGFSQGRLYLHTGNSIYRLGQDAGGNDQWQLRLTGIESAFAGGLRGFEGAFAPSPEDVRRCPNCQCYFICDFVQGAS